MTTVPSLLRRAATGTAAALALLGALTGCKDETGNPLTAPDGPSLNTSSSGTWPPGLDPLVRNPPFVVSSGKSYRMWYLLENTAPHTRSFYVSAWEPTGSLEYPVLTREYYNFAPGEKRWVLWEFSVKSGVSDGTELDFYFGANDLAGSEHGSTQHILRMRISNSLPVVAVEGGEHHAAAANRPDTINVWIYNPRPTSLGVCFRWLEDEGSTLGDMPQFLNGDRLGVGESRCKVLPPQTGFDTAYVYTYGWTPLQRQTLQVWNQTNGNEIVHAFRKTTVASSLSANRFYAFTFNSNVAGSSPLPVFSFGNRTDASLDRNYVSTSYHGSPCTLHLDNTWADFARRNLGETYVIYEEPGQPKAGCQMSPSVYVDAYRGMQDIIKSVDPSARIATAYFEQENPVSGPHFVRFADQFWTTYLGRYGQKPPIAEWNWILYLEPRGGQDIPQPKTLDEWRIEADSAMAYSLAQSRWGWEKQVNGQSYAGSGAAPVGLGIGFPHSPDVPEWDQLMTGMVDYIKARPEIFAAYWWILERWDHNGADPGDCVDINQCHFRLSEDGLNLNTYGNRYRTLTQ